MGKERKVNIGLMVGIVSIVITVIMNLIAYKYLPENVGIHWRNGEMDRHIGKMVFMILTPGVLVISNVYVNLIKKEAQMKGLLVNILLVVVNAVMIYFNVR